MGDRYVIRSLPAAEFKHFLGINPDLLEGDFYLFFG